MKDKECLFQGRLGTFLLPVNFSCKDWEAFERWEHLKMRFFNKTITFGRGALVKISEKS